jgi:hypothetical protein
MRHNAPSVCSRAGEREHVSRRAFSTEQLLLRLTATDHRKVRCIIA